jgi:FixJ family two-component response regulator
MAQDPQLLESLHQLFSRAGFSVSSFTKPDSLLGELHEDAPQCVVAENLSPAKATIQLVKQIHDAVPKLPIILIAAGDDISTAVHAIHAGAYDFVQKPIVDRLLIESVKSAISP